MGDIFNFLSPVAGILSGKKTREAISGSFLGPIAEASPAFSAIFGEKKKKAQQSVLRQQFVDESPLTKRA